MQIRNTITEKFNNTREESVRILTNITGGTQSQTELVVVVILGYIVLVLLLIYIHHKVLKKQQESHERLVLTYDTIRYQIARVQYEKQPIQESKGIRVVIEADHKNYLTNTIAIKQEILAIEQQLGEQMVSTDQRVKINNHLHKKNRLTVLVQVIGRITTILTIGIYKLFW